MINIIWGIVILIGLLFSIFTGNLELINKEVFNASKNALEVAIDMLPVLVLWMGLMKIAEDAGLLKKFSKILYPILKKAFPKLPKDNKALGYISSNIAINMFGLGSAATPFGLKAMEELQKVNPNKKVASDEMITFLIINTSGVTLIPTSVIALRIFHQSANPTEIIITSIIATITASIAGLLIDYLIRRKHQ